MCLIVIAHRAAEGLPLVVAANRDEAYDRPTLPAHWWSDHPDVAGGRDALHGGSWLAIARSGRLAAVTNVSGAARPDAKSRGFLVRDFVTSAEAPLAYASGVAAHASEYAGFHLVTGVIGGELVHFDGQPHVVPPGIFGISNGTLDDEWEKVRRGTESMRRAVDGMQNIDSLIADLLRFLSTSTGADSLDREIFVTTERYGTRSSTVVVASRNEVVFVEQTFERGGRAVGAPVVIRFAGRDDGSLRPLR